MEPVYNIRVAGLHTYFVRAAPPTCWFTTRVVTLAEAKRNLRAANAGGLKLSPPVQHAGANTGGSNVLQLTPELAAPPTPPRPVPVADAKLGPRDQLKATLRKIIDNLSKSRKSDDIDQFNEGFSEGFRAGAKGTLEFIASLPSAAGRGGGGLSRHWLVT